jgi:cysteine desulfurase family protein (TIGR01976 family)
MAGPFPIEWVRSRFPAVVEGERQDPPFAFLENAGGAQVPESVLENVRRHFLERDVYQAGAYEHAARAREFLARIRERVAEFMGASSPGEIVFGLNATTLLSMFATALSKTLRSGDEIITTQLEHEANVTPWLRLRPNGIDVRFWTPRAPEGRLDVGDLAELITDRTRLVAVTAASNVLGTITDIPGVVRLVHGRGAMLLVDAVHYAQHRRMHVRRDQIDACFWSGYKCFGSHMGFAAVAQPVLDKLPGLNHLFLEDKLKLELGMQNSEGLAAIDGVLDHLSELGGRLGIEGDDLYDGVFDAIAAYERSLSERLFGGLKKIDGLRIYGITDPDRSDMRTSTAAITVDGLRPEEVANRLGERGLGVIHGHMYAPRVVEWLGLAEAGGVVRISLCHYNTAAEIDRLLAVLSQIVAER